MDGFWRALARRFWARAPNTVFAVIVRLQSAPSVAMFLKSQILVICAALASLRSGFRYTAGCGGKCCFPEAKKAFAETAKLTTHTTQANAGGGCKEVIQFAPQELMMPKDSFDDDHTFSVTCTRPLLTPEEENIGSQCSARSRNASSASPVPCECFLGSDQ
eukprot:TRINITY_DN33110_c0_g1_i1.p1 TRINITY_DN33110_c0_g1~~TRINITY_DN33110_c0_g1_i1.p1  ORF type:complete len:161 (+),score=9.72 TRINITY_DN33110_c0_g1_i1:29-511(+)